jgi:hypothetical protein
MPYPEGLSLIQKSSEPLIAVAKDKSPQKRSPRRSPKKGVVLLLREERLRGHPILFLSREKVRKNKIF